MNFALNTTHIPAVGDYDQAYRLWQSIKPLRGYLDDDPRPIGRRESRNPKTIRVAAWEEGAARPVLAITYHRLDIATWYPEGDCVMQTYPSRSTVAMLNSVCPRGMSFHGAECDHVSMTVRSETDPSGMETRYYKLSGQPLAVACDPEREKCVRPHPDADRPVGTTSVEHWYVDRREANKWYKHYGLDEFRTFFASFVAMAELRLGNSDRRHYTGLGWRRGVLDVLEEQDPETRRRWMPEAAKAAACLAGLPPWGIEDTAQLTKDVTENLRDVIRRKHETFHTETVDWMRDLDQLKRVEKSVRKTDNPLCL